MADRSQLGRLFKLKLERNAVAREDAMKTIRRRPDGQWQARIGGRMRGKTEIFLSQGRAEAAVDQYYNALMSDFVRTMTSRPLFQEL